MKTLKYPFLAIVAMVAATTFTACSDDDNNKGGTIEPTIQHFTGYTEPSNVEATGSGTMSWHKHYATILKDALDGNGEEDALIAQFAQTQLEKADSVVEDYYERTGGNTELGQDGSETYNSVYGYKYVTINYESVDEDNNPIELSELVAYPYGEASSIKPNSMVIGCHYVITSNSERPTNYGKASMLSDMTIFASHAMTNGITTFNSSLVVVPDYEGYGASSDKVHPFLYHELTARQVVDGAIAAKEWFEKNETTLADGWQSVISGYSQGGSVAMAVHKYIEENNLSSVLNFAGTACGGGIYDPLATLTDYIETGKVYSPVGVAFMIKAMCDTNPYIHGKFTLSDFCTDEFLASGIADLIDSKLYTTSELKDKLVAYSKSNDAGYNTSGDYWEVDRIIRSEVISYFKGNSTSESKEKCEALYKALDMNCLVSGSWTPAHPLFCFNSTVDEVVPFVNYENASKALTGNYFRGRIFSNSFLGKHTYSGTVFFVAHYEDRYLGSIIDGSWSNTQREENI